MPVASGLENFDTAKIVGRKLEIGESFFGKSKEREKEVESIEQLGGGVKRRQRRCETKDHHLVAQTHVIKAII